MWSYHKVEDESNKSAANDDGNQEPDDALKQVGTGTDEFFGHYTPSSLLAQAPASW